MVLLEKLLTSISQYNVSMRTGLVFSGKTVSKRRRPGDDSQGQNFQGNIK